MPTLDVGRIHTIFSLDVSGDTLLVAWANSPKVMGGCQAGLTGGSSDLGASEVRGCWVPDVLSQGLCSSGQFWLVAMAMGMYLTWGLRAELGMESLFQRNSAGSPQLA